MKKPDNTLDVLRGAFKQDVSITVEALAEKAEADAPTIEVASEEETPLKRPPNRDERRIAAAEARWARRGEARAKSREARGVVPTEEFSGG